MNRTGKGHQKALRWLALRARSTKEVERYLYRKGCSSDEVYEVIQSFTARGYINDERFAKDWASMRLRNNMGIRRIQFELKEKGIPSAIIEKTLEHLDKEEYASARCLMEKKARMKIFKNKGEQERRQLLLKTAKYLEGRGFTRSTIRQVIDECGEICD